MELEPTTECGKLLHNQLKNLLLKSLAAAQDALHRVFIMYTSKLENPDTFLDALYGQGVLDSELIGELQQQDSSPAALLSRVRHAIGVSMNSRRVKELVVALEWSQNEAVLGEILKWAEEFGGKQITELMNGLSIDLAPERAVKTFRSQLSSTRPVSQREREISLQGKSCRLFGVCQNCNRIMTELGKGQIKIYNSTNLHCEVVLPYYNRLSKVYSLQCTCTEIIAGYNDGNICAWDMSTGMLRQKASVRSSGGNGFPIRLRWHDHKLAVARSDNRIQIWQYMKNSALTLLGDWETRGILASRIEFDEDYVILQDLDSHSISVYFPNGEFVRKIESVGNTTTAAYTKGKLLTGGEDKVLRIWDVQTGDCLQELEGHGDKIGSVAIGQGVVLTASDSGMITIWDITTTALSADPDRPGSNYPHAAPSTKRLVVTTYDDDWGVFAFGRNFVARKSTSFKLRVIDFC